MLGFCHFIIWTRYPWYLRPHKQCLSYLNVTAVNCTSIAQYHSSTCNDSTINTNNKKQTIKTNENKCYVYGIWPIKYYSSLFLPDMVCYSCVFVCYLYVLVCYSYVLVCYPYILVWCFSHDRGFFANVHRTTFNNNNNNKFLITKFKWQCLTTNVWTYNVKIIILIYSMIYYINI